MHGTSAREARRSNEGWVELELQRMDGQIETLHADAMLVATGRVPKIGGLDLAAGGIELDPVTAGPRVDRELRTTSPHAWAVGDAVGRLLYTHVANHEGPYAAKNALLDSHLVPDFYDEVPGAVFCDPELATVGLRSDEAAERGFDAVTGTYPMSRNGKARAMSKEDGFVRLVVERRTRRILGATLVCHDAANALQEILVAMAGDGTIAAIRKSIHTHPTIVEAVNACARELESQPVGSRLEAPQEATRGRRNPGVRGQQAFVPNVRGVRSSVARATWTGSISFGLINVPVRLYPATRSRDVRFNQLHEPDGSRIRQRRVCELEDKEVPANEIVKGFEISKGTYITLTR